MSPSALRRSPSPPTRLVADTAGAPSPPALDTDAVLALAARKQGALPERSPLPAAHDAPGPIAAAAGAAPAPDAAVGGSVGEPDSSPSSLRKLDTSVVALSPAEPQRSSPSRSSAAAEGSSSAGAAGGSSSVAPEASSSRSATASPAPLIVERRALGAISSPLPLSSSPLASPAARPPPTPSPSSASLLRRISAGMLGDENRGGLGAYISVGTPSRSGFSTGGGSGSSGGVGSALLQMSASLGAAHVASPSPRGSTPAPLLDVPRSSILMNPIKRATVVDAWRWDSAGLASPPPTPDATAPLTIRRVPYVASARERREAARERERARELAREKEREKLREKEKEAESKVWGIPKKAFYLGLPDINFNSQASMLAGWGNGSGTTDFRPNRRPTSAHGGAGGRGTSYGDSRGRESSQRERERERERRDREKEREKREKEIEADAAEDDPMDPEELAALNAIINTRRSAASAMALASGQVRFGEPSAPPTAEPTPSDDVSRSSLGFSARSISQNSVPTISSVSTSAALDTPNSEHPRADLRRQSVSSSVLAPPSAGGRIRFAPLPQAGTPLTLVTPASEPSEEQMELVDDGKGRRSSNDVDGTALQGISAARPRGSDGLAPDSDNDSDDDEGWSRRWSSLGEKSKTWLGLGMLSTSEKEKEERRGRNRRPRSVRSSRPSSVKSRSSSVGSGDEDERQRRRELIRASRPGGTGMVTLPDGTKIKARRVGEGGGAETDYDELESNEWGFAGLAREARRTSAAVAASDEPPPSALSTEPPQSGRRADDIDDAHADDDDLAWVKRRRRERELSGRPTSVTSRTSASSGVDSTADDEQMAASSDTVLPPPPSISSTVAAATAMREAAAPASAPAPPAKPAVAVGPLLNAQQAAEVRRRHEEEVAALGAEVLANIARTKAQAKQQAAAAAAAEAATNDDKSIAEGGTHHGSARHSRVSSYSDAATAALRSETRPATPPRKPSIRLPLRKPSLPIPVRKGSGHMPTSPSTPKVDLSSRLEEQAEPMETIADGARPTSMHSELATSASPLSSPASVIIKTPQQAAPASSPDQSTIDISPSQSSISLQSIASPSRTRLTSRSPSNSRVPMDTSISVPMPSHSLPRRPDARGYAVVPLPGSQLGTRPSRPREGRVWLVDDDDDDFDTEEDGSGPRAVGNASSDEDDEDMGPEELAEEERRTAMQKKRATTKAAGQEVMSKAKAVGANGNVSSAPAALSDRAGTRGSLRSAQSSVSVPRRDGGGSMGAAGGGKAKQTLRVASSLSAIRRVSGESAASVEIDEADDSDDAELWPPSVQHSLGARRPSQQLREEGAIRARIAREKRRRAERRMEEERRRKRAEDEADPDWGWVNRTGGGPIGFGASSTSVNRRK